MTPLLIAVCIYLFAGMMTCFLFHSVIMEVCKEKIKSTPELQSQFANGSTIFTWYVFFVMCILWPVFWAIFVVLLLRHFTK